MSQGVTSFRGGTARGNIMMAYAGNVILSQFWAASPSRVVEMLMLFVKTYIAFKLLF